jgi:cyclophilin family peptidyl-prolyl cis-trans isomerase
MPIDHELSRETHAKGAVAMAHPGDPLADSQLYVTLAKRDDLNGNTVIGHVIDGDGVPSDSAGDVIRQVLKD